MPISCRRDSTVVIALLSGTGETLRRACAFRNTRFFQAAGLSNRFFSAILDF